MIDRLVDTYKFSGRSLKGFGNPVIKPKKLLPMRDGKTILFEEIPLISNESNITL